jgi:regulator of cell morphogenesis and NO signaling
MTIHANTRIGEIATEHPLATRVFHRHGIDFCCGGGKPLADACAARGIDTDVVLEELRVELDTRETPQTRWDQEPLEDLIRHILLTYHKPLKEELPRLAAMARKVNDVHHDKSPDTLPELLHVVLGLQDELESHMAKEEQILFPMILGGQGAMADGPISVMEHEHASAGAALARLRELTNGYEVPEQACNTWRALWHGLAALEESLHQHIHLENNILFPRALSQ